MTAATKPEPFTDWTNWTPEEAEARILTALLAETEPVNFRKLAYRAEVKANTARCVLVRLVEKKLATIAGYELYLATDRD